MRFVRLFLIASLCLFSLGASAYTNSSESARQFIQDNANNVISIADSKQSDSVKFNRLSGIFVSATDINWMSKFALGQYWNGLSDAQKRQYIITYKKYLINSYVPLFRDYNGQRLVIKGVRELRKNQYMVSTKIKGDGDGVDIFVSYRLKFMGGSFKIKDIIAEDVSMISTQRADFSSIMGSQGYNGLINLLKSKS